MGGELESFVLRLLKKRFAEMEVIVSLLIDPPFLLISMLVALLAGRSNNIWDQEQTRGESRGCLIGE